MGVGQTELIGQVKKLLAGDLMIPSIQRDYVWSRSQIPRLLDSLYKGYPVGSLLIWETNLEVPLKAAAVVQAAQAHGRPGVLLDGQQRLTSLAWVYAPESMPKGKKLLDVRFDLESEAFLNPSATQRRNPKLISVARVLADDAQYSEILSAVGLDPSHADYQIFYDRLGRVRKIRDYPIPIQSYSSDDYEEVAEIFARVNTGGRRLSKGDLAMSAIAARWEDGLQTIKAAEKKFASFDFPVDREAMLRLMAIHAGVGADSIRLIKSEMTGEKLKNAWAATEESLAWAIDFFKAAVGVPKSGLLTSPNVVVIPAYLLHIRKQQLLPGEQDQLVRWVLTAMAFSHYSNQVESKLEAEAKAIREQTGASLWAEMIRRASGTRSSDTPISPVDLTDKSARSPFFNLLYIAALKNGARDWWNNVSLAGAPIGRGHKIEYHHIFPQARTRNRYPDSLRNSIANLAFLSASGNKKVGAKDPAEYLREIDRDELARQWIPMDPDLWHIDRFEAFCEERRRLLADELNELLGLPRFTETPLEPSGADIEEDFDPAELDEGSAPAEDETEDPWGAEE